MNKQEIFDTVARHIFKQGVPGGYTNEENFFCCQYRGEEGTSCAVGCLIPDEVYVPYMEGNDAESLIENYYDDLPPWMHLNRGLLGSLQNVHDFLPAWRNTSCMQSRLYEIVREYGLDAAVLDTLQFAEDRVLSPAMRNV